MIHFVVNLYYSILDSQHPDTLDDLSPGRGGRPTTHKRRTIDKDPSEKRRVAKDVSSR
jgi:hypothetical protein